MLISVIGSFIEKGHRWTKKTVEYRGHRGIWKVFEIEPAEVERHYHRVKEDVQKDNINILALSDFQNEDKPVSDLDPRTIFRFSLKTLEVSSSTNVLVSWRIFTDVKVVSTDYLLYTRVDRRELGVLACQSVTPYDAFGC
jgi:hypothetical protein